MRLEAIAAQASRKQTNHAQTALKRTNAAAHKFCKM
jgi:hypothetical protein